MIINLRQNRKHEPLWRRGVLVSPTRPPDGPSPDRVRALCERAAWMLMLVCVSVFLRDNAITLECRGSSADAQLTPRVL